VKVRPRTGQDQLEVMSSSGQSQGKIMSKTDEEQGQFNISSVSSSSGQGQVK